MQDSETERDASRDSNSNVPGSDTNVRPGLLRSRWRYPRGGTHTVIGVWRRWLCRYVDSGTPRVGFRLLPPQHGAGGNGQQLLEILLENSSSWALGSSGTTSGSSGTILPGAQVDATTYWNPSIPAVSDAPEMQWESRGQRRISQGVGVGAQGVGDAASAGCWWSLTVSVREGLVGADGQVRAGDGVGLGCDTSAISTCTRWGD